MAGKGAVLASRILNEISSLGLVVARVESAWKAAAENNDEFYFDSVALNIHSFYSGLERVFEKMRGLKNSPPWSFSDFGDFF
jgi:hypothetical protein